MKERQKRARKSVSVVFGSGTLELPPAVTYSTISATNLSRNNRSELL